MLVTRNLVMLDAMSRADQCARLSAARIVLLARFLIHFVAFFDKSLHSLARLGAGLLAEQLEALVRDVRSALRFRQGER